MQYFLFGLVALALALVALQAYAQADTAVLAKRLRVGVGVAALAGAGIMLVRGVMSYALPLAMLGTWLLWGKGGIPWGGWPGGSGRSAGQTSRVTTEHLEMELDH